MHIAAHVVVFYTMKNTHSYVNCNIVNLVVLLKACKLAKPRSLIVWASSIFEYDLI